MGSEEKRKDKKNQGVKRIKGSDSLIWGVMPVLG